MQTTKLLLTWFAVGIFLFALGVGIIFMPGLNAVAGPYVLVFIILVHVIFAIYSIWNFFNVSDPYAICKKYRPVPRLKRYRDSPIKPITPDTKYVVINGKRINIKPDK